MSFNTAMKQISTRSVAALAALLFVTLPLSGCRRPFGGACGNGLIDLGEICDGAELGGQDCVSQGFTGGTLACATGCTAYDTVLCTSNATCGDNVVDVLEDCDGADLGGEDCVSLGFTGGTLVCSAGCTYDTGGCTAGGTCGDGTLDAGEACDGNNFGPTDCILMGFTGGTLTCPPDCSAIDTSGCTGGGGFACLNPLVPAMGLEPCDINDPVQCLCEGCVSDGICFDGAAMPPIADDCICPDCATDSFCSQAANCTNDGLCDPFNEGCVCADCAMHPMCP